MALSNSIRGTEISPHGVRFDDDVVLVRQGDYRSCADPSSEPVSAQTRMEYFYRGVRLQRLSYDERVSVHRTGATDFVVVSGIRRDGLRVNDQFFFSGVLSERDRPEHGLQRLVPRV